MLANYSQDQFGVIYQVEKVPFTYDNEYVDTRYSKAPVEQMSALRFGHIAGVIGRIPESVLDVGYGSGDFLKFSCNMLSDVNGYDIPPAFPIEGITSVDTLYSRSYDLVTFFDSLEHFENPQEIRDLHCNFVHISVPWCHYFSDEWFENWKHRRPNEHLWHFDAQSLGRFMASLGFEMISYCNVEDAIRKSTGDWKNILSATFRRM